MPSDSSEEYVLVNGTQYCSVIGLKYPPPSSLAMYLRRFFELHFPLVLRQSLGFCKKEKLHKEQDFGVPIALALSSIDSKELKYVEEVNEFRKRIENDKELPLWWHLSILVSASDKETLRTRRARVISLLKDIGSHGVAEKRNLKPAFFSLFPGHDRFYLRKALISTSNAGDLLSAYVLYPGDSDPVDYLRRSAPRSLRLQPLHQPREGTPPGDLRAYCWRQELLCDQRYSLALDRQSHALGGGSLELLRRLIRVPPGRTAI